MREESFESKMGLCCEKDLRWGIWGLELECTRRKDYMGQANLRLSMAFPSLMYIAKVTILKPFLGCQAS